MTAPKLFFFSAHSNHLVGPIPALNLRKDCVNDASFVTDHSTCDDFAMPYPWALECKKAEIALLLLLHDNRLSCSLPEEVTSWPEAMRSISLVGNMGNGSRALPRWIHPDVHIGLAAFGRD